MKSILKFGLPIMVGESSFYYQNQVKNKKKADEFILQFHKKIQEVVENVAKNDGFEAQVYSKILYD